MANLAVIGSRKVNGVAELHSQLVQSQLFPDFVEFYGKSRYDLLSSCFGSQADNTRMWRIHGCRFSNVTNGITPRRWLDQCNPDLSALITETLGIERNVWLKDLYKLEGLLKHVDDAAFQKKWAVVKRQNKERLAHFVERQMGVKVDTEAMFDVQIKRLHEYKVRFRFSHN